MKIPENAFNPPLSYRFCFIPYDCTLENAIYIQVSQEIKSVKRAYQIAVEAFKECYPEIDSLCAVFYGFVEMPLYKDVFYTIKKFKKRFRLEEKNNERNEA